MKENEMLQLLPKTRKGILRIIFSRIGYISILMILELMMLISVYKWFNAYFKWFAVGQTLFSIGMVLYLFNSRMDGTVKLTWLFLIMLFPVPATIMLWITKADIGHRMTKERMSQLLKESAGVIIQEKEVLEEEELISSGTDDLCRYLNRSGTFPIYHHTEARYFKSGEENFEVILEELKKAESFIFLEYFIIHEGYMWGAILKILADKAKEGVDVRVMYDGMCEISLLPHDYPKRMEELGIKCKPFTPLTPFISTLYNYRDHRKIMVIDGKTAFTGGVNLSDEYINRVNRFGHWKDAAVMLKGDAVQSFTLMFEQMWNLDQRTPDWSHAYISDKSGMQDGFVMPFSDSPLDGDKVGENVYMDMLYRARTYIYIMTPYLILDNELETAITYAALRGVDVKIILPGIPDKKSAYALAKTHYKALVEAGVELYQYTPGFVHAKVLVSDNEKAVVGTINLDYRSLYHHFECATYLYKTECISDIEMDFCETLEKCSRITDETIKNEKIGYKALGCFLKVLAPLM